MEYTATEYLYSKHMNTEAVVIYTQMAAIIQ